MKNSRKRRPARAACDTHTAVMSANHGGGAAAAAGTGAAAATTAANTDSAAAAGTAAAPTAAVKPPLPFSTTERAIKSKRDGLPDRPEMHPSVRPPLTSLLVLRDVPSVRRFAFPSSVVKRGYGRRDGRTESVATVGTGPPPQPRPSPRPLFRRLSPPARSVLAVVFPPPSPPKWPQSIGGESEESTRIGPVS